jgi:hypothetical protein
MNVIYPFLNIKAAREIETCAICGENTPRCEAYSVMSDDMIQGYVCSECFLMFIDPQVSRKRKVS